MPRCVTPPVSHRATACLYNSHHLGEACSNIALEGPVVSLPASELYVFLHCNKTHLHATPASLALLSMPSLGCGVPLPCMWPLPTTPGQCPKPSRARRRRLLGRPHSSGASGHTWSHARCPRALPEGRLPPCQQDMQPGAVCRPPASLQRSVDAPGAGSQPEAIPGMAATLCASLGLLESLGEEGKGRRTRPVPYGSIIKSLEYLGMKRPLTSVGQTLHFPLLSSLFLLL